MGGRKGKQQRLCNPSYVASLQQRWGEKAPAPYLCSRRSSRIIKDDILLPAADDSELLHNALMHPQLCFLANR